MNEPYPPTTPARPISTSGAGSPVSMKMFMGFCAVFIIAQFLGTVLFCLYLNMRLDKTEGEITLHEDYLFLRRIQKCRKSEHTDPTLLDCKEIINRFQDLIGKGVEESHHEMQKDDRRPSIAIHLKGLQNSSKPVSVLQWQRMSYAPMNDVFAYHGGKLKVSRAGLYYIYSQVSFCTTSAQQAPFSAFLYLNLPSETDRLLLKGLDTPSPTEAFCDLHSIHLGGVFELRQGDTVFVNVTDSTKVNYALGGTYFVMFELH
uniref:CD40 ligand n=1 Tax=Sphenodon punctatus TaxID=8508 RepID=A0A8D0HBG5_SPHPU